MDAYIQTAVNYIIASNPDISVAVAMSSATPAFTERLEHAYKTIIDAVMDCGLTRNQAETLPKWLRGHRTQGSEKEVAVLQKILELQQQEYYTPERVHVVRVESSLSTPESRGRESQRHVMQVRL
jgi:hypothetical protein